MAEPTGTKLVTVDGGEGLDDFRTALAALELASLVPADERAVAVVREVIAALEKRLGEHGRARWEALPDLDAVTDTSAASESKLSYGVFARAEQAGKYRPLREEALRPDSADPEVAAIRHAASLLDPAEKPEPEEPSKGKKETLSKREQVVQRISTAACEDDGYRVQLIDLAAVRGGVYREALGRLYAVEAETLGRFEALARLWLDYRQLVETQKRDRGVDLEVEPADTH
jgi:hypothetical protein